MSSTTSDGQLEIAELVERLAGHVRRIDHTGVNLPARSTSPERWRRLLAETAARNSPDDEWRSRPEWQFSVMTDLSRPELEELAPEGLTFPGLEDIFRVVRTNPPWNGPGIRFDLAYRVDGGPTDWDTGE